MGISGSAGFAFSFALSAVDFFNSNLTKDVDFNIVSSVFGKGSSNVIDWIKKGLATYINKEKALAFLSHPSAPIAAAAANAELDSYAKIQQKTENDGRMMKNL